LFTRLAYPFTKSHSIQVKLLSFSRSVIVIIEFVA
jgi:hypothetical protein